VDAHDGFSDVVGFNGHKLSQWQRFRRIGEADRRRG
jgi:hypothetical protein